MVRFQYKFLLLVVVLQMVFSARLYADENAIEIQKVAKHVYALVGKRGPMDEKDLGTNATFGAIVMKTGIVLIDPGASYQGAKRLHETLREIADKPITHVINTGSEDHRWLGNSYFKQRGAKIIAAKAAVIDQKARANDLLTRLEFLVKKDGAKGTTPVYAGQLIEQATTLNIDGLEIQLHPLGTTYTPGTLVVWLPAQKVLFTGDMVAVERMPAVGTMSKTTAWVKAFEPLLAFKAKTIIPGHGHASDPDRARKDTLNYLTSLQQGVKQLIEDGGGLDEVSKVDQSKFKNLIGFEMLKGRNAHQVFQELEWE